jgi:lysophospholipase L1-like esterase
MFMQVAAETPLTYVDLFEEHEDDPFVQQPEKYVAIDGLHPTNEGYGYWYERLQPVIDPLLPRQ